MTGITESRLPTTPICNSFGKSIGLIAGIVAAAAFAAPALAGAHSENVPNFMPDAKTGWIIGKPDTDTPIGDDFYPPKSGPGPITYDKAHPFIDNRRARALGTSATNRYADLSNPILLPWVREELRQLNKRALSEIQLWTPKERCWPIGVPGWLLYPVRPHRFLQQPNQVVLIWEEDEMFRHVYLTDKHTPNFKPTWFGDSIGHYENGDTLVVDTIGISTRTRIDNSQTPHSEQLHVVERYRLVDNGEAIDATVWVEDPGAFTTPWTGLQRFRRNTEAPLAEEICAENNPDQFNQDILPIPTAEKPDF
jgi:hypothetical protein